MCRKDKYVLHMKNILTKKRQYVDACCAVIKQQKALKNNSIRPLTCKFVLKYVQ